MPNESKNIIVIGATGVVGKPLIKILTTSPRTHKIYAATRNIDKAKKILGAPENLYFRTFDITDSSTYNSTLADISTIFLIRPPEITRINAYVKPFLKAVKYHGIKELVFQSVEGAKNNFLIPHHRIEKLIKHLNLPAVILRPSYFMQNLTTGLLPEIKRNNRIYIPAGKAVFNWLDANDFAHAAATILTNFQEFKNQKFTLTGTENYSFTEVATILQKVLKRDVNYQNTHLLAFYFHKLKQGYPPKKSIIMGVIHQVSRFKNPPDYNGKVFELTHKKPITLKEFIERESSMFDLEQ